MNPPGLFLFGDERGPRKLAADAVRFQIVRRLETAQSFFRIRSEVSVRPSGTDVEPVHEQNTKVFLRMRTSTGVSKAL